MRRRGSAADLSLTWSKLAGNRLTGLRVRDGLSVTLLLSLSEEYDGADLVIEAYYGVHEVEFPGEHPVRYPARRDDPEMVKLTGIYRNPVRFWAKV